MPLSPAAMYYTGLLPTDNMPFMAAMTEFFATRLVKKGSRRDNPFDGRAPPALTACIEAFRAVIRALVDARGAPVPCGMWESACEQLSFAHKDLSHWVCPVRMAEYLAAQGLVVNWAGVMKEKRRVPPSDFLKKRERKERGAAEPTAYHCACCGMTCNSAAQMVVHTSGSRHKRMVAQQAAGVVITPPAQPQAAPMVVPLLVHKASDADETSSAGCSSEDLSLRSRSPEPCGDEGMDLYTVRELEGLVRNVVASLDIRV